MLKFLFSWSASQQSPSWNVGSNQDSIDLQVQSLTYVFKRLNVPQLEQFARGAENRNPRISQSQSKFQTTMAMSNANADPRQSDEFYNLTKFQHLLYSNEHRVLIDWAKNYFRALCILSDFPSTLESLPKLGPNFKFVVLPANTSRERYVDILSHSDMYMEHLSHVTVSDRRSLVETILDSLPTSRINSQGLNLDTRYSVIVAYLETLARAVQVERLYRASVRLVPPQNLVSDSVPAAAETKQTLSTVKTRPSAVKPTDGTTRYALPKPANPSHSPRPSPQTSPSRMSTASSRLTSSSTTTAGSPAKVFAKSSTNKPLTPSKIPQPTHTHAYSPSSSKKTPAYSRATSSSTLRAKKSSTSLKVSSAGKSTTTSTPPVPVLPVALLDGTPVVPPHLARQLRKQAETAIDRKIAAEKKLLY